MILLYDTNNLIFRAFFSVPSLSASNGIATNALYGVLKSFRSTIQDFKPDAVIMVYDSGKKTFRHEFDDTYKANRPPVHDNLKIQFPLVQEFFTHLNVPQMTAYDVECDDLIGTLATKASEAGIKTIIVSSDKDFYQLVDKNINVFSSVAKRKGGSGVIDLKYVRENFEVEPCQLVDIKSLTGEKTDNIQGVKGIGPKTATAIIKQHGDVFKAIKFMKRQTIPDKHKIILESLDIVLKAYHLAKIKTDVPIPDIPIVPVEDIVVDDVKLLEFFKEYDMNENIREIGSWKKLFQYKISLV